MDYRKKIELIIWIRRFSQLLFFFLFLYLLYKTTLPSSKGASTFLLRPNLPVEFFFYINPLIAIITLLSSWHIYKWLSLSLITIIVTLLLGRVFCGWICPLGTINQLLGWSQRFLPFKEKIKLNSPNKWKKLKYIILFVILGMAISGSTLGSVLDPITIVTKGVGLICFSCIGQGIEGLRANGNFISQGLYFALSPHIIGIKNIYINTPGLLVFVFTAILALNFIENRFWCRYLCPLGGLLGILSRWQLVKIDRDKNKCTQCKRCLTWCHGASMPDKEWRGGECFICLNCVKECPEEAINILFKEDTPQTLPQIGNISRREFLTSTLSGSLSIPFIRVEGSLKKHYYPYLIRPPGAINEKAFLERCIRCGLCMKICPQNALHPSIYEGGIETLWTPVLVARIGYCDPSCTLCSQICPTGALAPITPDEKKEIKLGTAFVDRSRCLPWAMDKFCIVCEEYCPVSPKAIKAVEIKRIISGNKEIILKGPKVVPELCIGCGACEHVCPVQIRPAIYILSVGETRNKDNKMLL